MLKRFSRIYPLSKTLRFELKPIGRTMETITSCGLLEQDQHRSDSYVQVKKIIDEYHKAFIESSLETFKLVYCSEGKKNSLEEFYTCYMCKAKDETQKKLFDDIQDKLRKQIADCFSKTGDFSRLFSEKLIKEDLNAFIATSEQYETDKERYINIVNEFGRFTTYFTGFHENRKNMYSAEDKSTAIAYRLIHENLPRFIDNMQVFDKVATSPVSEHLAELYINFEEYLNVAEISEMFRLDYYNVVLTQKQIDIYNYIIGGKTLKDGTKIKGLNEYINLYNQQQKE